MTDTPEAVRLADEYRPTMTAEVLHSWAVDAAALLRRIPELEAERDQLREALSATQPAQASQSEPFGFIHHYVAHDSQGGIIDSTWEADGCDDEMPHPTHPLKWGWERSEPFYTHPTPAQPAQVVPEGWRLVPVEPTPEMKAAGITIDVYSEVSDSIGALTWAEVDAIYRAMLAAATPQAQADANGSA